MKRTLSLKTERLVELTSAELVDVAGAQNTPLCVTEHTICRPSDVVVSVCRCLETSNCSHPC